MSHRKFRAPRHGSLAFLPRKRAARHRGRVKSFPKDNKAAKPHLTAFIGYKAGMTHIVRDLDRPGNKRFHKREIVEPVTILETPPMTVVGVVGYIDTPSGLRALTSVWAGHLDEECLRRFYKNWYRASKAAYKGYQKKVAKNKDHIDEQLKRISKFCTTVRVIAHTQVKKLGLKLRKAHIMEIQVNGGTVPEKVAYAKSLLEQDVRVGDVFSQDEMLDTIGVSKGKGFEGVTTRWGVSRLPRKTHRGLRKVACIGAWHPANVQYSVARAGQNGYHHRTERNKKVYRVGEGVRRANGELVHDNATTEADLTVKSITPVGGFPHYGQVMEDYLMIKGGIVGTRKRPISLRKAIETPVSNASLEKITLKFIDTSSKMGKGRFQTSDEKKKFMGTRKRDLIRASTQPNPKRGKTAE